MSDTSQVRGLLGRLRAYPSTFEQMKNDTLKEHAELLLTKVKEKASGPPGPNVITGSYVNAFYLWADGVKWEVRNPSPQARRLEYGFFGDDSLGRTYHQAPRPHMRPALMEVGEVFKGRMRRLPIDAWKATK